MSREARYKLSADMIVALHVIWTFVLFGGAVFVLFAPWYAVVQIITISFTLLIALPFGNICPLTLLEERLRKKIDPSYTNNRSYLTTYINKIFGTDFRNRSVSIVVAVIYILSYAISIATLVQR